MNRLATLTLAALAIATAPTVLAQRTVTLPVGDTVARAVMAEQPGCAVDVLVLHDNENTGSDAAAAVIAERGGRLVDLRHTGARNLGFRLAEGDAQADSFYVDPNRIFSSVGAQASLSYRSPEASVAKAAALDAAVRQVRQFASRLLGVYGEPAVVVTAHNNTEARYAATSYAEGGPYADEAAALHLEPDADPDDFFFVTDRALFDTLAAQGFNAVLQAPTATDDGSLSVWAAQQGVSYVNVEAQHGHLAEQVRMMHALWDALCEE